MKVLMATYDFPPSIMGGEGYFAKKMAELLPLKGIELEVLTSSNINTSNAIDNNFKVKINRVPVIGKNFLTKIPSFAYHAKPYVNNFKGDIIFSLRPIFIKNKNVKVVTNFRTTRYGEAIGCLKAKCFTEFIANMIYVPFDLMQAKNSNMILVFSRKMKQEVCKFYPSAELKTNYIRNGVDKINKKEITYRIFDNKSILYVGRLDIRKGIIDLIKAFRYLKYHYSDLTLGIIGKGPLYNKIRSKISKYKLDDSIKLLGYISHSRLIKYYYAYDLVVVPSIYEPFGRVILEAMSCDTPVISSDACVNLGQPQFKTHNIQDIIKTINYYISFPDRLRQITYNYSDIIEYHLWDKVADELISYFNKL